jgi:hypothetical protein
MTKNRAPTLIGSAADAIHEESLEAKQNADL